MKITRVKIDALFSDDGHVEAYASMTLDVPCSPITRIN